MPRTQMPNEDRASSVALRYISRPFRCVVEHKSRNFRISWLSYLSVAHIFSYCSWTSRVNCELLPTKVVPCSRHGAAETGPDSDAECGTAAVKRTCRTMSFRAGVITAILPSPASNTVLQREQRYGEPDARAMRCRRARLRPARIVVYAAVQRAPRGAG
jgi:hypothetical protein